MGVYMDGNEKEKEGEEEFVCRFMEGLFIGISFDNQEEELVVVVFKIQQDVLGNDRMFFGVLS